MDKKSKKEVKLVFLIPEGCRYETEVNDLMKMAFQESLEASLTPQWLSSADCDPATAKKSTVFVMQEFKGDLFKKLAATKAVRVCGPMCLRSCLAESLPIPENKSPVFTAAMRDVIVTASQVPPDVKAKIKEKVGFMGGVYMSNLVESVTHLVTNAVRSAKYEIAGQRGIPIMTTDWVDHVWELSQTRNIKATDPEIITKYKCPIFLNMFIACSNLSKQEKEEIKTLVTQNGGTFTPQLRQKETTLLVVKEPRGEKYTHARSWDLPCVRPSYVKESVRRGYAVPSSGHLIEPTVSCSTPTKDDGIPNFTLNSETMVSVINFDSSKTHIDDTQLTNCTQASMQASTQPRPGRSSGNSQWLETLQNLTVKDAKKAGSFVDGCKVFLSGFSPVDSEKLTRILSLGGATVFSELSDSVSHVIVGEFIVNDIRAIAALAQKPHLVTVEWLAASIKQRAPVSEEPYYCMEARKVGPEPPSPLSQKGMQLLQPPVELSETAKMMPPPAEPVVSRKLFSEFVKENAKSPAKQPVAAAESLAKQPTNDISTSMASSQESSTIPEIFQGQKFLIAGFDSGVTEDIEAAVQAAGGCVVPTNFTGIADYAVVPLQASIPNITAVEVVTNLWLEDCLDNAEVLPIRYYHQPFNVDLDKRPLEGCCLTLSNYFGKEKLFLTELAQVLGATYQDVFARTAKEDKGLLPSTHLICPRPEGNKYKAAVRWNLPALTKDWLQACARLGIKIVETPYQVSHLEDLTNTTTPKMTPKTTLVPDSCSSPSATVTPVPHPSVASLKRKSNAITPDDQSPFHVSTPDTPYGQVFETPTAETKKRWKRFIDDFPYKPPQPPPEKPTRRLSTPLSELKRRIWAAALEDSDDEHKANDSVEEMRNNNRDPPMDFGETPLREAGQSSKVAALRGITPGTPSSQRSKDCENIQPRRLSMGRSTPTVSDFRTNQKTPLSQTKAAGSPQAVKKSPANELVCAMLGELHQRLSTPGHAEEPRPLPQRELVSPAEPASSAAKPATSAIMPESQPVLIGWEDPVESKERAKMASSNPSVTPNTSTCASPRKFVLSNVKEREKYEELLRSLGQTVISANEYVSETTHLVVDEPVRSEKLLCCLAAGKWVLHTSYIDQMAKQNKCLPEEKFEWGNPESVGVLPSLNPSRIEYQLACAAVRWRKALSGTNSGAFTGMKAILITSPSKVESFKRLVLAGGGEIVPVTAVHQATHCFVESNKLASMPVPLAKFVAHEVPCLPPIFLGDMLIKCPPPPVQAALIPEYKKLLSSTSTED